MTALNSNHHGCRLCALEASSPDGEVPFDSSTTAYLGDDAIILARDGSREVLVAPARHVSSLTGLAPGVMAELLATLRRVALAIGSEDDVEVKTMDLLGAPGHVCIRLPVRPEMSDDPDPSSSVVQRLRGLLKVSG